MKKVSAVAAIALVASGLPTSAGAADVAGVFSKGRTHFVVTGGPGHAFDEDYFVLGLGVSYYVIDGLNLGLFVESWSGGDPGLYKITPSVNYVFHAAGALKPYVGGFYRRTEIEGLSGLDSVGGRAGAYLQAGRNAFIGVGVVYESYLDCNESTYRSCDSTYGEVSVTFAF